MTNHDEVYLAALAGLLHDIGKFAQRAGVGKYELTDKQTLNEVRYEHALFSDSFLREYVPERWRSSLSAPRRHHNPQSDQDYQVQLADWLSAAEREEEDEDQHVPFLLSPFARLEGHSADGYFPLERLDPTRKEAIFPRSGLTEDWRRTYREQYHDLWEEFVRECKSLPQESLFAYLESLYGLMQEFTWCIPSAYQGATPDVSLYDHGRTTAALAACLAADGHDATWCSEVLKALRGNRTDGPAAQEVCLLVGGDINGVQAFIYTISSGGAAKGLRARSFYLQLLTEAVARYLLDTLGLPSTNLLYAGGGGFQILAPTTSKRQLEAARAQVARQLLAMHSGALGLTIEWVPVSAAQFKNFQEVRKQLGARLAAAKRRPFATVRAEELAQQVGCALEFDKGGDLTSACQVCGAPEPREDTRKCLFCESLEELGSNLPRATHLLVFSIPAGKAQPEQGRLGRVSSWREGLRRFGSDVYVVNRETLKQVKVPEDATLVRIWHFDPRGAALDTSNHEALSRLQAIRSYRPFAQLTPYRWNEETKRPEIATFGHLAEESARGVERWGVLRADVDNLGTLFQSLSSLSRTAAMSRALQVFFEGYLPTIGEEWNRFSAEYIPNRPSHNEEIWEKRKLRDQLYVQYAGGDDIFVVGAWDALPEFALRLQERFAEYTCHNPHVSLSAGIALADAKFPLYQAARWAGDAEEDAKQFVRPDNREKKKAAVTFLGQTLGWEYFTEVHKWAHQLADWCEQGKAPRSLIHLLLAIDAEWRRGWELRTQAKKNKDRRPKFYFGRWMWQLVYYLTRAVEKKGEEVKTAISQIEADLLKQKGTGNTIEWIGLAARWAELLVRG